MNLDKTQIFYAGAVYGAIVTIVGSVAVKQIKKGIESLVEKKVNEEADSRNRIYHNNFGNNDFGAGLNNGFSNNTFGAGMNNGFGNNNFSAGPFDNSTFTFEEEPDENVFEDEV